MMVGDISGTRYLTEGDFKKVSGTDDNEQFFISGNVHIETYLERKVCSAKTDYIGSRNWKDDENYSISVCAPDDFLRRMEV